MSKEIKLKYIVKIQNAQMRIFEAEDEDYPDGRIIAINYRAIDHWLEKITPDKEEQVLIYKTIDKHNFNTQDNTFKPICDDLRELGYTIVYGKE